MLKCALIGNLGSDAELRYGANGNAFLRFNVASNFRRYEDGVQTDATQWVRVTVGGARAETIQPYLKKGQRVYVDGRLEARPWVDQQGNPQAGLEIFASEVQFASSTGDREEGAPQARPQGATGPQARRPAPQATRSQEEREARARAILGDDEDDPESVPF
jgi:single-strand DNA-binding protein